MSYPLETKISNFIERQFPSFYKEDGENFILFVKAYYEWLEETNNPIYHSRNLLNYTDIDNTLEEFLTHFQEKYLFGIPFEVVTNKRFLLKHILEVYRSKSSVQGHKLLFKLLYNEDAEIYLPGRDVLRVSDGTWVEPKYIEVTNNGNVSSLIGKQVIGVKSRTTAVVESYVKENFYRDTINTLYISNIYPRNGDFIIGEKVLSLELEETNETILASPSVIGSLNSLEILNGGQDFKVGDIIKITKRDDENGAVTAFGQNGSLRVSSVTRGFGALNFNIFRSGSGLLANSLVFIYNSETDTTGVGASFSINNIGNQEVLTYNTDLVYEKLDLSLDDSTFGFAEDPSANLSSTIGSALQYETGNFGSLIALRDIFTGNNYTDPVNIFVRSTLLSDALTGTITYSTSSNTVTGSGTVFTDVFSNDDVIALRANSELVASEEYQVIKEVVNSSVIILYGPPSFDSTASSEYRFAPSIIPANFSSYEENGVTVDDTIKGENGIISGNPLQGNNVISTVDVVDSGKGYLEGEEVIAYLSNGIAEPTIISGGIGYANGESLVFSGGGTIDNASGFVVTDNNGTITSLVIISAGSGYEVIPNISVQTTDGNGARFTTTIEEFNTFSRVIGRVSKKGIGKSKGYWSTTRGFLNSDKYIQDSYFYQDYSYQIKIQRSLNDYKDIILDSFHTAGSELFGEYVVKGNISSNVEVIYNSVSIVES